MPEVRRYLIEVQVFADEFNASWCFGKTTMWRCVAIPTFLPLYAIGGPRRRQSPR
jgi:hypothetical protein